MYNNDEFSDYAKKYMDMVFRIAYSYLKCQADADDVTQDALIQLYRTKKEFLSDTHVKNWLVRVTINLCKNVFRSAWHKNESIEDYANSLHFEVQEYSDLFSIVMSLDKKYIMTTLRASKPTVAQKAGSAVTHRGLGAPGL